MSHLLFSTLSYNHFVFERYNPVTLTFHLSISKLVCEVHVIYRKYGMNRQTEEPCAYCIHSADFNSHVP